MAHHPTDLGPGSLRGAAGDSSVDIDDESTAIDASAYDQNPGKLPGPARGDDDRKTTDRMGGGRQGGGWSPPAASQQRPTQPMTPRGAQSSPQRGPQSGPQPVASRQPPMTARAPQPQPAPLRPTPARGAQLDDSGQLLLDSIEEDEQTMRADSDLLVVEEPKPREHLSAERRDQRQPALAERAAGKLVIIAGNDKGKEFALSGTPVSIGRGLDNHIVLTDIAVSRKHVVIEFNGSHYVLTDKGSGNGTMINERLETGVCRLHHGDRLELGQTTFRFEHAASRHAAGAPRVASSGTISPSGSLSGSAGAARSKPATLPPPFPSRPAALPPPGGTPAERLELPSLPRAQGQDDGYGRGAGMSAPAGLPPPAAHEQSPLLSTLPPENMPPGAMQPGTMPPGNGPYGSVGMGMQPGYGQRPGSAGGMSDMAGFGPVVPMHAYAPILQPHPRTSRGLVIGVLAAIVAIVVVAVIIVLVQGDSPPVQTPGMPPLPGTAPAPRTGERLPASTWGTDETLLAAAVSPGGDAGNNRMAETLATETEPESAPEAAAETAGEAEESQAESKADEAESKKSSSKASSRTPSKRTASKSGPSTATFRKRAMSQYRAKDFRTAARTLREANDQGLDALAAAVDKIGADIDKGNSNKSSNPVVALSAYQRALSGDKKHGEGAHQSFLRSQLGEVAPKAASVQMGKNRYEDAKKALDLAVNYGAGSTATVQQVRKALERKAEEFYKSALRMNNKPTEANALLRRVLAIVPPDSPWYAKAYTRLNARKSDGRSE